MNLLNQSADCITSCDTMEKKDSGTAEINLNMTNLIDFYESRNQLLVYIFALEPIAMISKKKNTSVSEEYTSKLLSINESDASIFVSSLIGMLRGLLLALVAIRASDVTSLIEEEGQLSKTTITNEQLIDGEGQLSNRTITNEQLIEGEGQLSNTTITNEQLIEGEGQLSNTTITNEQLIEVEGQLSNTTITNEQLIEGEGYLSNTTITNEQLIEGEGQLSNTTITNEQLIEGEGQLSNTTITNEQLIEGEGQLSNTTITNEQCSEILTTLLLNSFAKSKPFLIQRGLGFISFTICIDSNTISFQW